MGIILNVSYFAVRVYRKALRLTGLYYLINKSDTLFGIYVLPHRIFHIFRRRSAYNFSYSYVLAILSGNYKKTRGGECKMCGACCKGCPHLVPGANGTKICAIYKRRDWCDVYFPATEEQFKFVKKLHNLDCGFYYKDKT